MRENVLIRTHAKVRQNLLEEEKRTSRNGKEVTGKEMLENMQICRTRKMAGEKEWSRIIEDSKMFGNSKQEGNHKPSEDKPTIKQSVACIYRLL
jgi:hypothetical protein